MSTAAGGREALEAVAQRPPAVIVLDVTMPDLDGIQVVKRLRADGLDVPVCILSARDEVDDRVRGLRLGGDDYLTKPFSVVEVAARLEALLRRSRHVPPAVPAGVLRCGDLELTRREFELLETFARHPRQVLSRDQLLDQVWGYNFEAETNVADVFVGYLRRKLEAGGEGRILHTVRGVGWALRP